MKNKIPLFTLILFLILGIINKWSAFYKVTVIINSLAVLVLIASEIRRLLNGRE